MDDILRTSPGKRLEDVSWRMSSGRLLEDVLTTSLEKVVATSISDKSRTSLRPKLRRFYDVFATSLCRLGMSFSIPANTDVFKISSGRLKKVTTKQDVVTTSGKRRWIYDVLKKSDLRRLEDVQFTTS